MSLVLELLAKLARKLWLSVYTFMYLELCLSVSISVCRPCERKRQRTHEWKIIIFLFLLLLFYLLLSLFLPTRTTLLRPVFYNTKILITFPLTPPLYCPPVLWAFYKLAHIMDGTRAPPLFLGMLAALTFFSTYFFIPNPHFSRSLLINGKDSIT